MVASIFKSDILFLFLIVTLHIIYGHTKYNISSQFSQIKFVKKLKSKLINLNKNTYELGFSTTLCSYGLYSSFSLSLIILLII